MENATKITVIRDLTLTIPNEFRHTDRWSVYEHFHFTVNQNIADMLINLVITDLSSC